MGPLLAIPALLGATTGSIATGAGVGTSLSAVSAIGGKLVSSLVLGGLSVGLSMLLRPPVPEPQNGSIETQQAVPPRTFIYGRLEIAGSIAFKEKQPGTSRLHKICLMHDGEIDAWETVFLDDRYVVIDPVTGYVTNAWVHDSTAHVQIFLHNGADDQAADAQMLANFPDLWTADHTLSGIAYALCVFWGTEPENFVAVYANGEPVFKAVVRGRRVYDPRDSFQDPEDKATWLWSDNAALCILDWISLHPKGYRIDLAKLDLPSFGAMADICDELVSLTSGGSEKRYRVATQVSLKETRTAVLARLREACDGHLYLTGDGKWALRGGEWTAPTVTLDVGLGHILDLEMRDGMDALTRYNELSLRYLSPDHNYGDAECDPWQGTADPEFVAGKVKTQQLDLLQVPSYTQARRLAKLMMAFDNPSVIGQTTTNFYGLNAVGERNITLNWSEPGETIDGPFWVEPDLTLGENGATVSMSLRAADPTAYDWDPETEEGEAVPLLPPVDLTFDDGVPPDNPVDFAVEVDGRSVVSSWTPPADTNFHVARVWRVAPGAGFANAFEVSGPRQRPFHWPSPSMAVMTYTDPVAVPDDWEYHLTVENPVGLRNTPLGPLSTTPPALWTPTDLGAALKAWWHADDTADGAVATWTDRIASIATTAAATVEPISAATSFNSAYRGLTFDGTNDCLISTAITALPTGAVAGEIWALLSYTGGTAAGLLAAVRYGSTGATARGLQRNAVSSINRFIVHDGTTGLTDTVIDLAGPHIIGGMWSGTTEAGRIDGRDTTPASATIATLATATTRLRIGATTSSSAAGWWPGVIRHVLVTTTLTATEREKLEGWMAHDAALTSVLPGGHPYKTTPPTV